MKNFRNLWQPPVLLSRAARLVVFSLSTFLVSGLFAETAFSQNQAFFVGGAQTAEKHFVPYIEALRELGFQVKFEEIDSSPFTADHGKQLVALQASLASLNADKVLFVGFSAGGKFVSKLAIDSIRNDKSPLGVVLFDPVGGPPPLQDSSTRFPDLLEDTDTSVASALPALIFNSGFGPVNGPFGTPCVTANFGASYFLRFFASAQQVVDEQAGHLDYLGARLPFLLSASCKKGTADSKELRQRVVVKLKETVSSWLLLP